MTRITKRFNEGCKTLREYFSRDIWLENIQEFSKAKKALIRIFQFISLVIREFGANECSLRASRLTYRTLLAMVPMLAVVFFLFQWSGSLTKWGNAIKPFILKNLATGSGEIVITQIDQFLANIQGEAIGIVGLAFLIFLAISLLSEVENAFNRIWRVTGQRGLITRIFIYWGVLTLGPLLLGLSLYVTAYIESRSVYRRIMEQEIAGQTGAYLIPFFLSWIMFFIIYIFMPNTQVKATSAALGAFVGGSFWEIAKWGYALYATRIASTWKIYGSAGAILLFLIWIYLTWIIILLGAQIAFAHQRLENLIGERLFHKPSQTEIELASTMFISAIVHNFQSGNGGLTLQKAALAAKAPPSLAERIRKMLCERGWIVQSEDGMLFPGVDPGKGLVADFLRSLRTNSGAEKTTAVFPPHVASLFEKMDTASAESLNRMTLADLADLSDL